MSGGRGVGIQTDVDTDTDDDADVDVCVVGAGIAGLVVAAELARGGLRVVVLDREVRVGGMLAAASVAGIDADAGAESFATRGDAVPRVIEDFGLDAAHGIRITAPRPDGAWLVHRGRLGGRRRCPLPSRTVLGIPAEPTAADVRRIIGAWGARRAGREHGRAGMPAAHEPSLLDLVRERMGAAVAVRLVDPVCRSVYSRPAATLRLSQVHPTMWAALLEHGTLAAAAAAVAADAPTGSAVLGIHGGMWRLAAAMRDAVQGEGGEVRTGQGVRALAHVPAWAGAVGPGAVDRRIAVHLADRAARPIVARRVVLAVGAADAQRLLAPLGIDFAPAAAAAPPVTVGLVAVAGAPAAGAPATDPLAADPVGSGAIAAPGAVRHAKAMTHVDAKWDWVRERMPAGWHLVRLSSAGPDGDWLDDPAAVAEAIGDITGRAIAASHIRAVHRQRWDDATTAAAAPDRATRAAAAQAATACGIDLVGAAVAGTGLAAVIPHARSTAGRVLAAVTAATTASRPKGAHP